jgi:hypothetical protein
MRPFTVRDIEDNIVVAPVRRGHQGQQSVIYDLVRE